MLGEARQRAVGRRGAREARREVGVEGAEQRAVADVQRGAEAHRGRAARDEAAEQHGIVVADAEDPLVERLLRRPHARRHGAGEGAAQGP